MAMASEVVRETRTRSDSLQLTRQPRQPQPIGQSTAMDAVVITKFGGPEVLQQKQVPKPEPVDGEVLIEVKAFGLNNPEMHTRKGDWEEYDPVPGLECAGVVVACPRGDFEVGSTVVAVMGGMGRSRHGSYGEFVSVPSSNVVPIRTELPWEDLAALPEVYCTAWTCVFTILDVKRGERLLIRGATSTLGQAALHLAVDAGADVTVTTRQETRFRKLQGWGAVEVKRETRAFEEQFHRTNPYDKVLNLVGNSVLLESVRLTKTGGRMLQAGWLGGLAPLADFNPMTQMKSGVHFSLFHSKELGTPDFPIAKIPLQEIVDKIEAKEWCAKPARVFEVEEIQEAHKVLEAQSSGGKLVVKR